MTDLFALPIKKTLGGKTSAQLVDAATIIKTQSNDYLIRVADLELNLTDDGYLSVSDDNVCLARMIIDSATHDKLALLHEKVEENYQRDALGEQ